MVEKSIARLKSEDRGLPQIRRIRDLLSRGVAVHHGGLLPIVKEVCSWNGRADGRWLNCCLRGGWSRCCLRLKRLLWYFGEECC